MPLHKQRPELERSASEPVPGLTHQPSLESVRSPITPSHDASIHPANKTLGIDTTQKAQKSDSYPFPTPINTHPSISIEVTKSDTETPKSPHMPSQNLAFLSKDPFAHQQDDDIIPFDKNKPIIPSRHGSVRSIMSTSSMQSLKRGLGSIKRSLSRSRSKSRSRRAERKAKVEGEGGLKVPADGLGPPARAGTYMMSNPKRVDTYQVSAMAF